MNFPPAISSRCWRKSRAATSTILIHDFRGLECSHVSYRRGSPTQSGRAAFAGEICKRARTASHRCGSAAEIIHRYTAINRREAIQAGFEALFSVVEDVFEIDRAAAERAKEIVMGHARMSARDAIHLAVMEKNGVERIFSFDMRFDGFPGITRVA
ncbi:MAG TPA: type II toxin-antitoxin system VapC family toxin [Candidatus Solibacter sp.]|nr:type II toxin-antitoxin system VapC family toxin [Candidatus Solibacter sp.]